MRCSRHDARLLFAVAFALGGCDDCPTSVSEFCGSNGCPMTWAEAKDPATWGGCPSAWVILSTCRDVDVANHGGADTSSIYDYDVTTGTLLRAEYHVALHGGSCGGDSKPAMIDCTSGQICSTEP